MIIILKAKVLKTSKKKSKSIIVLRNKFIKARLRNLTYKWPPRNEIFSLGRIDRGIYKCSSCQLGFHYKQIERDHIDPVIPLEGLPLQESGEIDWNSYIPRLFCGIENFSLLCLQCHLNKTTIENSCRTFYRDEQRKQNKTKLRKNVDKPIK